jgi:hypothetical protein
MRAGNDWWFQFYPLRWMGSEDVVHMSAAERGVYISLIAAYHALGPLTADLSKLAQILVIDRRTLARFMQKWGKLATVLPELNKIIIPKCNEIIEGVPLKKESKYIKSSKTANSDDFAQKQEGPEELPPMTKEEEKQNAERVFDQLRETAEGRELADSFQGARSPVTGDSTNGPEKPKSQERARGEGRAVKLSLADYCAGEAFGVSRAALDKLQADFPDCDLAVEVERIEGRLSDDDASRPKNPVAYLRACLSKGGYAVRRLESPTGRLRHWDDLTPEELEQRSRLPEAQREVLIGYRGQREIMGPDWMKHKAAE